MKKNFLLIPILLSLILLSICLKYKNNIHTFNSYQVFNNIKKYSSEKYKGRLAGSLENDETSMELKQYLQCQKLKPLNGNYFDGFTTDIPAKIQGLPYLKIVDNSGNIIKEYNYGTDYKEDMLNFKSNSFTFNNKDEIGLKDHILQIKKDSQYFIFYVPDNNSLNFRSSFIEDSIHSMYIMITEKTFQEIKDYILKNYSISCFIPFQVKNQKLNNVTGYIKGKNSKTAPLIISAHFDHVGTDLSGTTYPGALDNASGMCFVMELEKYLKSLGKPERNIIFAFFNAEELGCKGSEHFAEKYKNTLNKSKVFNFDMIGSDKNIPLSIMAGSKDNDKTPLVKEISSLCINSKVKYNTVFQDSSDHESFRKYNISALTFCDDDLSRIHTPEDKSCYISTSSINDCYKVISKEVKNSAYKDNLLLNHYNTLIKYSIISSLLFSVCYLILIFKFH